MEGESQSGGGRISKGSATDRAIMALEHVGFVKANNLYGIDARWYGRTEGDSNTDDAAEILINRAKFVMCDIPNISNRTMLKNNIDVNKPCLSNKSGEVFVLFDTDNGAVIL